MVPTTTWHSFLPLSLLANSNGALGAWPGLMMPKTAVPHLAASQIPDPVIPDPGSSCGLGDMGGESILIPQPSRFAWV